jgi:polysaccharide pyruvyl transferase WcaK-like protein
LRRAVLIPCSELGSIGDAAMTVGAASRLRELGFDHISLLSADEGLEEGLIDEFYECIDYFKGRNRARLIGIYRRIINASHVFMIGADVIDGKYSPLSVRKRLGVLGSAARLGKSATLLGSSYNTTPESTTKKALIALPASVRICARDPLSRERLQSALRRPIEQVADLALLVKAEPDRCEAMAAASWMSAQRADGRKIIGLVLNALHSDPPLIHSISEIAQILIQKDISIVMAAHDHRPTANGATDEQCLKDLLSHLSPVARQRTHLLRTMSPGVVKAVFGAADLLVSGRLHAIILASGLACPSIGISYQGKFEGFMSLIGQSGSGQNFAPEEISAENSALLASIEYKVENSASLRSSIEERLPSAISLAMNNIVI